MHRTLYRVKVGAIKVDKCVVDRFDAKRIWGKFRQCRTWQRKSGLFTFTETLSEAKQVIIDNAYDALQIAVEKYKGIEEAVNKIKEWDTVNKNDSPVNLQSNLERKRNSTDNGIREER